MDIIVNNQCALIRISSQLLVAMVTVPLTGRVERLLLSRLISVSSVQLHKVPGSSVSLLYLAGQTDRKITDYWKQINNTLPQKCLFSKAIC